jgi:hypothetical protein
MVSGEPGPQGGGKRSSLLEKSSMNVRFPQFHMSCKERKSSKKKETYDG